MNGQRDGSWRWRLVCSTYMDAAPLISEDYALINYEPFESTHISHPKILKRYHARGGKISPVKEVQPHLRYLP